MGNSVLIPAVLLMIYSSGSVACRLLILLYLSFSPSRLSSQLDLRRKKPTHQTPHCINNGAITMLWEDWTEERSMDAGGGWEAACLRWGAWTRELAGIACEGRWVWTNLNSLPSSKWTKLVRSRATYCRLAEVWEELQVEVDKLPEAGHQEGQVKLARRADHHPASRSFRQQVSTNESSQLQIVTK